MANFGNFNYRPGETVQNLQSPGLSGRVDSSELMPPYLPISGVQKSGGI